jgi:hypothetical protein
MVSYVSRAQWGARKAKAAYSLVPSQVKNTAFHYPGTANPINAVGDAGFRRVCSALRGWQAYHMDTRGWSDIAYCIAIDQVGRAYTLRGINIRSAANGGTQANLEYGAILLVLGNNEAPSAAMKATARAVVQDYRVRFSRIPQRPTWHGAIRPGGTASDPSTDCPGKLTIAQIKAGEFDAASTPVQPPKDWFDMATLADLEAALKNVVPAIVADELNKQDRDLWINGTGKSQVIDPIQQIVTLLNSLPVAVVKELMQTKLVDMLAPFDPATDADGKRPEIAYSSHIAHMPTRVAQIVNAPVEPPEA